MENSLALRKSCPFLFMLGVLGLSFTSPRYGCSCICIQMHRHVLSNTIKLYGPESKCWCPYLDMTYFWVLGSIILTHTHPYIYIYVYIYIYIYIDSGCQYVCFFSRLSLAAEIVPHAAQGALKEHAMLVQGGTGGTPKKNAFHLDDMKQSNNIAK